MYVCAGGGVMGGVVYRKVFNRKVFNLTRNFQFMSVTTGMSCAGGGVVCGVSCTCVRVSCTCVGVVCVYAGGGTCACVRGVSCVWGGGEGKEGERGGKKRGREFPKQKTLLDKKA